MRVKDFIETLDLIEFKILYTMWKKILKQLYEQ